MTAIMFHLDGRQFSLLIIAIKLFLLFYIVNACVCQTLCRTDGSIYSNENVYFFVFVLCH